MPTRANGQPAFGVYLRVSTGIRHGIGLYVLTPHLALRDRARRQKWPRKSGLTTSSARPCSSRALSINRLIRRTYPLPEEARRKG